MLDSFPTTIMFRFATHLLTVAVLSLETFGSADPEGVIYAAAPEQRGAFYVGGKGVYNYGYNTGDGIAKVEVRNPDGSVTGSYRYFDPLGRQIVRSYIADDRGFRVLGNDLPISPETPAVGILDAQTLTAPVEGAREFASPTVITLNEETPKTYGDISSASGSTMTESYAIKKHDEAIMAQEELIRKQEERLSTLKAQRKGFLRQQQSPRDAGLQSEPKLQVLTSRDGYYTSLGDTLGSSSPYLYSEDNIGYDFPAGFAYNAPGLYYSVVYPVGVQGMEAPATVTAGQTAPRTQVYTSREYKKPVYRYWRSGKQMLNRHPYIIGHMK